MHHKAILLLAIFTITSGLSMGNTELLSAIPSIEKSLVAIMEIEIKGPLQLYSILKEDIELIDTESVYKDKDKNINDWQLAYNRNYFVGYNETKVEAITPSNFKKMAKKYFAHAPELVANIGKKGFRYKNLPTMILYYNKKLIQRKALIKKDKLKINEIR